MLFLQLFVIGCFIVVIVALFREEVDFLSYCMAAMFAAVIASYIFLPETINTEDIVLSIEWEVIFFLMALFGIVEVLHDQKVFQEIALRITTKFHTNTRKFFWIICLTSTISAAFIEDLSVAIIFVPIIIRTSEKMKINPAPFLLGMTICINLASTLTPFGSAENILIATRFELSTFWFFTNLGIYFVIGTFTTLFLLDRYVLRNHLNEIWEPHCRELSEPLELDHVKKHELVIEEEHIESKAFQKNMIALLIFFVLMIIIPSILFVGVLGLLVFIFINPRTNDKGKKRADISYYLSKIDYKIIFFFICLFILVYCMEINGTIAMLEDVVLHLAPENVFLLCIFILIITSVLSGFLDNVPVTILFIPVIGVLINAGFPATPLLIAFILGVNLGGNIFPQGSAADMMTLELSDKYCVDDMNYKRLLKVGGAFALLHIIIGIIYLAFLIPFY